MTTEQKIFNGVMKIIKKDKDNVFYLLYYAGLEAILVLSIPLAASFIINSILAHSRISVFILGFVVIVTFILVIFLRILKEYIIENFQQKIFINNGIDIIRLICEIDRNSPEAEKSLDKYMNYFFDVTSIQKVLPVVLLDGSALVIKIIVSLLLLFVFNPMLFIYGLGFFFAYLYLLLHFGKSGIEYSIKRSDAKHQSIYYLQNVLSYKESSQQILETYDGLLDTFVKSRKNIFKIIIKQLSLTFVMEGIILSGFLILGGSMVINGSLPIGEFVAAEIIIVSIVYALSIFAKQIDYIYEMIEGFYKVEKLSIALGEKSDD